MMIVMKEGATEEEIAHVVERVENIGCSAHVSKGEILTVIGAIGDRGKVADLGREARITDGAQPAIELLNLAALAPTSVWKERRA